MVSCALRKTLRLKNLQSALDETIFCDFSKALAVLKQKTLDIINTDPV